MLTFLLVYNLLQIHNAAHIQEVTILFRQNAHLSTCVYFASPIERAPNAPPHLLRCEKPRETAGGGGRGRCPSKKKIDKRKIEGSSANHPATNLTPTEARKFRAYRMLTFLLVCMRDQHIYTTRNKVLISGGGVCFACSLVSGKIYTITRN